MSNYDKSYQAGLNGQSEIGHNRDAYAFGQMTRFRQEQERAAKPAQSISYTFKPVQFGKSDYAGGTSGTAGMVVANLVAWGLVAIVVFVYFTFATLVSMAIIAASVIAGAMVLALIGLPVFKLVEWATPAGTKRSGIFAGYLTMLLAFLAFGLTAALVYAALYGTYFLTGEVLHTPLAFFAPIAYVIMASQYFFADTVAPPELMAALGPYNLGLTIALVVLPAFAGGAFVLSRRSWARFGGLAGYLRGVLVIVLTFVFTVAGGFFPLAYYLASIGV